MFEFGVMYKSKRTEKEIFYFIVRPPKENNRFYCVDIYIPKANYRPKMMDTRKYTKDDLNQIMNYWEPKEIASKKEKIIAMLNGLIP